RWDNVVSHMTGPARRRLSLRTTRTGQHTGPGEVAKMRRTVVAAAVAALIAPLLAASPVRAADPIAVADPTAFVNPLIGTANGGARPGFYSVKLDSGATADLTATLRTGSGRFTFPAGQPATVLVRSSNSELVSTDATVHVDAARHTVTGSVTSGNFCGYIGTENRRSYYTLHFHTEFDQPFT